MSPRAARQVARPSAGPQHARGPSRTDPRDRLRNGSYARVRSPSLAHRPPFRLSARPHVPAPDATVSSPAAPTRAERTFAAKPADRPLSAHAPARAAPDAMVSSPRCPDAGGEDVRGETSTLGELACPRRSRPCELRRCGPLPPPLSKRTVIISRLFLASGLHLSALERLSEGRTELRPGRRPQARARAGRDKGPRAPRHASAPHAPPVGSKPGPRPSRRPRRHSPGVGRRVQAHRAVRARRPHTSRAKGCCRATGTPGSGCVRRFRARRERRADERDTLLRQVRHLLASAAIPTNDRRR